MNKLIESKLIENKMYLDSSKTLKTKFSILITTKDRLKELKITLQKTAHLLSRNDVACIVYDDGSKDGTFEFIKINYPNIQLLRNETSKGLIFCRNVLLSKTNSTYAISIDDDLHFLSESPIEIIEEYFENNPDCGVVSFSTFWNIDPPSNTKSIDKPCRTRSFLGGSHAIKMTAWQSIPNYPDWFIFYGEEDFASYHLFKNEWQVHYLPQIITHHRVDIKRRKKCKDYLQRSRRALRSGWYLYFLFIPLRFIPKKIAFSIFNQIKLKTLKGDWKATLSILLAIFDLILNSYKIIKNTNRLTTKEYHAYLELAETKIYWKPEKQ